MEKTSLHENEIGHGLETAVEFTAKLRNLRAHFKELLYVNFFKQIFKRSKLHCAGGY